MNYQIEYQNDEECVSVKYKGKQRLSEATEYSKGGGGVRGI